MSLTSCWPKEDSATKFAVHAPASNIIYLHNVATRGQDATTVFNDYIKSGPVVVDFYADWCGPCKMMARTIDQLATKYSSITFLKVDIEQFKSLATGIKSLPTLAFYKNGAQIKLVAGFRDKKTFEALLTESF